MLVPPLSLQPRVFFFLVEKKKKVGGKKKKIQLRSSLLSSGSERLRNWRPKRRNRTDWNNNTQVRKLEERKQKKTEPQELCDSPH